jgi:hypothetical protein
MTNNDIDLFQNYISAYPVNIAKKLTNTIKKALAASSRKDHYWLVNKKDRIDISELFRKLLNNVKYPQNQQVTLLAKDISDNQLPLLNVIAKFEGLYLRNYALPNSAHARQRWLGIQPGDITEREISVGEFQQVPLWYALQTCYMNKTMQIPELLSALSLSLDDRLELFGSMSIEEYDGMRADLFRYDYPWGQLNDITSAQVPWAINWADKLIELNMWGQSQELLWPILTALVKDNVSIKPEWEEMLPMESRNDEKFEIVQSIINLIPADRRTQVIAKRVSESLSKATTGLNLLPLYPSAELTQVILNNIDKCSFLSPKEIIKRISEVAEDSPEVRSTLDTYNAQQNSTAITLKIIKTLKPASYNDLTKTHKKQLKKSGELYGAEEYPLDERIAFFASDSEQAQDEGDLDFADQLTIHLIGDEKGNHLYDAFLYMTESGTIFKAKKTDFVATISQGGLSCKDSDLKKSLLNILKK